MMQWVTGVLFWGVLMALVSGHGTGAIFLAMCANLAALGLNECQEMRR